VEPDHLPDYLGLIPIKKKPPGNRRLEALSEPEMNDHYCRVSTPV
jgi:hypothetical protein